MAFPSLPPSAIAQDGILTLPELAKLLKVAEKTVYTMAEGAEVPGLMVRGRWRFCRGDIDPWFAKQVRRPAAGARARSAVAGAKKGRAAR